MTINGYTWRSTVGKRGGYQYIVVNADARRNAGVRAGDVVTITLEPDTEKREIEIPLPLRKELGTKLTQKLDALSFTHKKEFIVWYSEPALCAKAVSQPTSELSDACVTMNSEPHHGFRGICALG